LLSSAKGAPRPPCGPTGGGCHTCWPTSTEPSRPGPRW